MITVSSHTSMRMPQMLRTMQQPAHLAPQNLSDTILMISRVRRSAQDFTARQHSKRFSESCGGKRQSDWPTCFWLFWEMKTCLLLLCLGVLGGCHGLYFHIQESETKCFSEELPDDTMVVGKPPFL